MVLLDRQVVPREWWPRIRPREGARVDLTLGMHGGGDGKQALALIAAITISVMAPWAAVEVFGMAAGSVGAGVVAAGIAVVGNLALAALFKPPPTAAMGSNTEISKAYSFQGQSNAFKPYGVLPRVLGMHRVYPDVVGVPYTEVLREATDDPNTREDVQYLRALYCFGYGGVIVDDIRIGENPLSAYTTDYEVYPDFKRGDKLRIFVSDVAVDQYSLALKQNVPISVRSRLATDSAVVDLYYPMGLGTLNTTTGGFNDLTATNRVEFRDVALGSSAAWLPATAGKSWSVSDGTMGGVFEGGVKPSTAPRGAWGLFAGQQDFDVINWLPIGSPGGWVQFGNMRLVIEAATSTYLRTTTGLPQAYSIPMWTAGGHIADRIPFNYGTGGAADWVLTRHQPTPFATSVTIAFPYSGQWEIRFTRLDADSTGTQVLNDRTLNTLRSFTSGDEPPIVPDVWRDADGNDVYQTVALIELRVKATDQLSGTIGNLNALVTTKLPKWNGADWVPPAATVDETWSNPAWEYLELLRGPANKRPVKDERIDLPAFKAWADRCDRIEAGRSEPNARCNYVVDKRYTLWQLLNSVAASGRAMPAMRDNKYSVIVDDATKPEVQIFSPRNSWGLSATRRYLPMPHALRVKWIDPAANYQEAVRLVYADGYNETTATVFEDLELFGCTSSDQAWRDGRVWFARAQLQVEEFTLQTDIENLVCTRGDLIGIAHDVLSVGGWSARLEEINGKQVRFDSELKPFEPPWALRHRADTGAISSNLAFTSVGGGWFDVPGLPPTAKLGDLVLYGTAGVEQGRYIVKAVMPGNDLTASISCIEYAPGIYAAETGAIPPYVPQGQSPESFLPSAVIGLVASVNAWSDGQFPHASVSLAWSPPASALQPSLYLVSEVLADGTVRELGRTASLSFVALPDVDTWRAPYAGALVTFSVVAQWPGVAGPAATTTVQLPTGVVTLPVAPTGLVATPMPRFVLATWSTPKGVDIAYYAVRFGAVGKTWDQLAASEAKVKANHIELPATFLAGDHLVFVCVEDVYGGRSAPVSAPFHVDAPRAVTVVGTAVQNTVFLRWGSLSGVPDGEWTAQTTFQIEYYEVVKTHVPEAARAERRLAHGMGVIPAGVVTAQDLNEIRAKNVEAPPVDLGRYSGEFAVLSEQQEGMWHYCMAAVDIAGNRAPQQCKDLKVIAPDNYFLLDALFDFLPEPECIKTNAVAKLVSGYLAPVNTAQTWAAHFESHSWDQPADQVAFGTPVYAAPPGATRGVFSWSHDYQQNLPSLLLSTEVVYTAIGPGVPLVVAALFAKTNAGDAWTEIARGPVQTSALLPPGTRYVRIDIEVDSDANGKAMADVSRAQFTLDVQYRDDGGMVTTDAAGTAHVTFNVEFLDVRTVQLTSGDPEIAYARYQLDVDEQGMSIFSARQNGTPKPGVVSWFVRGI
ncbi:MAG TPA: host specificity factor TipJ family phage tail protein [Mycobacterium sp.]|nr:host specificity factor TipJ family phage tail protein [Mycobacterium sp.]